MSEGDKSLKDIVIYLNVCVRDVKNWRGKIENRGDVKIAQLLEILNCNER